LSVSLKTDLITTLRNVLRDVIEIKNNKQKRKFAVHNREYWLSKGEIQDAFGCPAKDVEEIWQGGEQ
jgi:hypothetical protein